MWLRLNLLGLAFYLPWTEAAADWAVKCADDKRVTFSVVADVQLLPL